MQVVGNLAHHVDEEMVAVDGADGDADRILFVGRLVKAYVHDVVAVFRREAYRLWTVAPVHGDGTVLFAEANRLAARQGQTAGTAVELLAGELLGKERAH